VAPLSAAPLALGALVIINHAGVDNPWHRAAAGWVVASLALTVMAYSTLDGSGVETYPLTRSMAIIVGVTALLYAVGARKVKAWKLSTYAAVLGIFAYIPILVALCAPLYFLFLVRAFSSLEVSILVGGAVAAASIAVWHGLARLKWSLQHSRFVEKEFVERSEHFYVRRDTSTELPAQPGLLDGSVGSRMLSLSSNLIYLLPFAYIAQRMVSDAAGEAGVLTLLAILSIPLAIHVLSQIARGYYLWIHIVRKIERASGKPVIINAS
jgi:hypothetical protein